MLTELESEQWHFQACYNDRTKMVPTGVFGGSHVTGTFFSDINQHLQLFIKGETEQGLQWQGRVYWDFYKYGGRFAYQPDLDFILGSLYES